MGRAGLRSISQWLRAHRFSDFFDNVARVWKHAQDRVTARANGYEAGLQRAANFVANRAMQQLNADRFFAWRRTLMAM
jgi:hypothetical protein